MGIRKRVFEIIEKAQGRDIPSRIFDITIIVLIVLNTLAVVINSFNELSNLTVQILRYFEIISVIIFTIEYFLRIWTAKLCFPKAKYPEIKYILSLMALIDLLAILPFYLPFIIKCDLRFLRMLRLFRLLRIFKINRYNNAMTTIEKVIKNEKQKLISTIFIALVLLLFAASIMYYIENEAQPEKFPNIIAAVWWAIATLTTVGYGDVYPVTVLGKILSGVVVILGIGLIALPTGIISSGFINEVNRKKSKRIRVCPHCGKEIDEE